MINIAIDGPSGAGKSTLSKSIAKELGYIYVDTGAMYRAIGLYFYKNSIEIFNDKDYADVLKNIKIELKYKDGTQLVFLNGQDVSSDIRIHIISDYASKVSAVPSVREFLLQMQRDIAKNNNIVMDGRDIGTVVLPNAKIKIFLTASANIRAKRRYNELLEKGQDVNFDDILSDVIARDERDSSRAIAPLKPAEDSIVVDTTDFSFDESLQFLLKTIKENM